ncbi:MAG TPA: hypothetical protein VHA37_03155 [Candidatus Saccharimonadales bacterium]|nr:hypothetical protein [Candidatus Saccharimonadales bacterium]
MDDYCVEDFDWGDSAYAPADLHMTLCIVGQPRQRSGKTTNLDRILADLLDDVLEGLRSPLEADAAYRNRTGARAHAHWGRERRFKTFAEFVAMEHAAASDPSLVDEVREVLYRAADRTRTATQRRNDTNRANRLLEVTDPVRISRLQDIIDELREAVQCSH